MRYLIAVIAMAGSLVAQTGRTVQLAWQDTVNPTATQYNVYRAPSSCAGTPTFTKLNASPVATRSYNDSGVAPGTYCYRVTAVLAGLPESAPSSSVDAAVGLAAPSGLTITIQIALTLDPQGNLVARSIQVDAPTTKGN